MGDAPVRLWTPSRRRFGKRFEAELRQGDALVAVVYGDSTEGCMDFGRRLMESHAACSALPDPERDVALLLEVAPFAMRMLDVEGGETEDGGPSAYAESCIQLESRLRALLARINPEPANG